MPIQTREVPSVAKGEITHEDVLRLIPQHYIDSLFLRSHLDRELVLGTVGDRGAGKSATDAVVGIVSFMLAGKPVWSNMKIRCDIQIDDAVAREYGLKYGGVVHYESLPLEKAALLKLDETYRGGCLVIEEINVQYSNVRRFMSNTNVDFNEVCQQLRKFKTSLVYNVIDEMFIDSQLRALTDIFISTYDTAFDLDSLANHKQTGVDFRWKVFPMTGYLAGEQGKYSVTHKSLPPIYFHFAPWRGVYDSMHHQEKGVYSQSTKDRNKALAMGITAESSPEMIEETNEWGWLGDKARELRNKGTKELVAWQLWQHLELAEHGIHPSQTDFQDHLVVYGIHKSHHRNKYGERLYSIDNYSLGEAG